jgi:uncharacterized protein (DUF1330 family)
MAYELVVGLDVRDQELYKQYRAEMTPLLHRIGGSFRFDFAVERTLKSEAEHDINRVFVITFPDAEVKTQFFAKAQYREIRTRLYERAVAGTTIIAEYAR